MVKKEVLREYLLDLLLTSNIKYMHDDRIDDVYLNDEKRDLLTQKYAELAAIKQKRKLRDEVYPAGIDNTDYNGIINNMRDELEDLKSSKTMKINEDSSLEEIAEQIRCLDLENPNSMFGL